VEHDSWNWQIRTIQQTDALFLLPLLLHLFVKPEKPVITVWKRGVGSKET